MRYRLARALQFIGLVILPIAILSELEHQLGLGQSVGLAVLGTFVFYLGFRLQAAVENS